MALKLFFSSLGANSTFFAAFLCCAGSAEIDIRGGLMELRTKEQFHSKDEYDSGRAPHAIFRSNSEATMQAMNR